MSDDITENVYLKVGEEKNIKSLNHIDVGTKAKMLLSNNEIMASSKEKKFRMDCRSFFVTAVQYLQSNLPYDVSLLQHAQFIHPEKRNSPGSLNAISNLAIKITSVLNNNNCLDKVFGVKGATKESLVDQIRDQWRFFQNEEIKEEWYKFNEEEANASVARNVDSYWKRAEEMCGIESEPPKRIMKRIDEFWAKIGSLVDEKGSKKYSQLVALVKCVLSLSHGNSTPERGFSINKLILEVHGYSTYEDTLTALRLVKDELLRVGGETKFPITKELLSEVKLSYSKYEADRVARKAAKEAELKRKKECAAEAAAKEYVNKELEKIEDEISDAKAGLSVANDLILQAQSDLEKALQKKGNHLQRNLLESANSKLKVGTDRKRKFQDDLDDLEQKRKKMLSSKK